MPLKATADPGHHHFASETVHFYMNDGDRRVRCGISRLALEVHLQFCDAPRPPAPSAVAQNDQDPPLAPPGLELARVGPTAAMIPSQFRQSAITFWPRYWSALWGQCLRGRRIRGAAMVTRILNDLLLFSCLTAFITGIVLAAATLLI
jgi:hypothetical protein